MRDNIAVPTPMDTLSRCGLDTPFNTTPNEQKPLVISVSSNVYYGYQPHRPQTNHERLNLVPEDVLNKTFSEMDTDQFGTQLFNIRKRAREPLESSCNVAKRMRQNEPPTLDLNPNNSTLNPSPSKIEEELLRETHGCTYYHWVSSNI